MFNDEEVYISPKREKLSNGVTVIHIPTNPDCREYHFRKGISGFAKLDGTGWGFDGTNRPELLELIFGIDGISSVFLSEKYCIMVSRSSAYEWSELEPKIKETIEIWQGE